MLKLYTGTLLLHSFFSRVSLVICVKMADNIFVTSRLSADGDRWNLFRKRTGKVSFLSCPVVRGSRLALTYTAHILLVEIIFMA